MVDHARAARMADRIKEIVATTLDRGIKDPRLGFVTVTDVRVTGDLQQATVFYTVYGTEEELRDTAAALKSATGMLRSEVGKQLRVRLTPTLEFVHDALPENVNQIEQLLAQAKERDEAAHAASAGASFAGDADPYVKPRELAADDDHGVDGAEGTSER
ncbi:30S ribosome-binding factor RbfA [Pseudoclavibacter chungangensis]|uniref:Ribosome-binding factor A n=1 Tax=Pseudoclavibacter chungangensis TaxID=587635 RepID=A0A7J5BUX4_9MICO|nr:30S ribosome-binding factor RbfA [Pseudoclavibacter chungangensis]KAB1657298.1 30S ribosome-binding factor RbfA [Pseudoclavibacter chungangensis]NYJ66253.1 ribosome-binding factor A [Pseudoclavibacter chungangensis]